MNYQEIYNIHHIVTKSTKSIFLFSEVLERQGTTMEVEKGEPLTIEYKTNGTLTLCYVKGPTPNTVVRSKISPKIPTFSGFANLFRYYNSKKYQEKSRSTPALRTLLFF